MNDLISCVICGAERFEYSVKICMVFSGRFVRSVDTSST